MASADTVAATPNKASEVADATAGTCSACAHRVDAHDAIAIRFCAVTAARALSRGCA